jgi:DNA repair protein RadA
MKTMSEPKIEDLPGIGAATAEKLREGGYDNLMSVAVSSPGELADAAGLGESVARKAINAARDLCEMGFESGDQLLERRAKILKITTGAKAFDEMLDGGFETGSISECYGTYGSGKSQVAHVLAVTVQKPVEEGGADGVSVFIDGEGTFRPERIKQIAEGCGMDAAEVLKKVRVARAYNSDHQMLLVAKVEDLIKSGELNVKVIIVDSLTSHFRAEYAGRGQLADRQQKLNRHMHALARLAQVHNICVYVTNQVMAKPDTFFGDPTEAIGGNIVGHNSAFRIYLRRGKKGTRVGKLIDSPNLPESECIFNVTEKGMEDI